MVQNQQMDLKNKYHNFTLYNGLLSVLMYKGEVYSTFHKIPSTKKHRIIGNYKSLNKKYYNI